MLKSPFSKNFKKRKAIIAIAIAKEIKIEKKLSLIFYSPPLNLVLIL